MSKTSEMLDNVESAIANVLSGGQSYKIGSRTLTRADLNMLYKMRNDLKAEQNQELGNTGLLDDAYVVFFDGR
ncbi:hypothetical protein SAMN02746066_03398 [Anaerosporobacter mobilis DSM 15930]|jgi:hypothetical protein|uniref:Peptidylprolyl isomerase n=1 Tax=Anaerosporobacter mobilis DSM 15930 TaxID=1120996 RepID=A0A1M7LU92_9FIRM|nr:peptidylprolyl isomerase [Anaerosporobacter mobilis]SHM81660.1 hypothetical protein SAMN02746066_03398 [Anaerosporobacter mobilis DSM 15930]